MITETLFTYGPMGVMLAWFMLRTEKIIQANTNAITKLSLAVSNLIHSNRKV